jgi:hypothetical protein
MSKGIIYGKVNSKTKPEFVMSSTDHKRECQTEKEFDPLAQKSKQICLPLDQAKYQQIVLTPELFRAEIDQLFQEFPELFPIAMGQGYTLHDTLPFSKKLPDIQLRRLKLQATQEVFTVRPAFVLPYMTGHTAEVEKPLFLRRWAVPYWVLVYLFGRDEAYWYRLENRFGRNSLVGTTLKDPTLLPQDLLADEKHTDFNGQTGYIATTVGQDCVLGASICLSADSPSLTEAYGHFKTEARNLAPDYTPATVNTDGWSATQLAWPSLFPLVTVILCFLHAFLNIRNRAKGLKDLYPTLKSKVWTAYHALDRQTFTEKVTDLQQWAKQALPDGPALTAVLKLCAKAPAFALAYDYPSAHRTSNMVDRHMLPMSRYLDSCQGYHGHLLSAEYGIRAWALFHNFGPYGPRSEAAQKFISPAHRLNGRVYHQNWLHNLLISASMGGFVQ